MSGSEGKACGKQAEPHEAPVLGEVIAVSKQEDAALLWQTDADPLPVWRVQKQQGIQGPLAHLPKLL